MCRRSGYYIQISFWVEPLLDLFLYWNWNARKKRREPIQLGQKVAAHRAYGRRLPSARPRVHRLVVVEVVLVPLEEIVGRLRVSDVHESYKLRSRE